MHQFVNEFNLSCLADASAATDRAGSERILFHAQLHYKVFHREGKLQLFVNLFSF